MPAENTLQPDTPIPSPSGSQSPPKADFDILPVSPTSSKEKVEYRLEDLSLTDLMYWEGEYQSFCSL